tara:strand:- start:4764 stop:5003 length:240 start_codon:yes stop_codon:yes gene_type:complete
MVKIGWIGLLQSISLRGSPNVGRMPSMNESARGITIVNFGGTFAMKKNNNDEEGVALLLTILLLVTITVGLNAIVWTIL